MYKFRVDDRFSGALFIDSDIPECEIISYIIENNIDQTYIDDTQAHDSAPDSPEQITKDVILTTELRVLAEISNHKVTWKVTDDCYGESACDYEFLIVDQIAPTPYCVEEALVM